MEIGLLTTLEVLVVEVKTFRLTIDDALTADVSTLKVQVFPVRVASVIHSTETSVLSTILHEVYEQGLVAESVKY